AHAFVLLDSQLRDLNNEISASAGWTNLIWADGINDLGQITGSGFTASGEYHAYVLTPAISLTSPTLLPSGRFSLTVVGLAGQRFVLLGSPDLLTWTALATNTLASNSFQWIDSSALALSARFYRARTLP